MCVVCVCLCVSATFHEPAFFDAIWLDEALVEQFHHNVVRDRLSIRLITKIERRI